MKKIKVIKKIVFVFFLSFLLHLNDVNAGNTTYYVTNLGGNGIEGFYSYAYYQKTTEYENASYKSAADCKTANGTFDTTDCKYWWYTYNAMCTTAAEYKSCTTTYLNNSSYNRYKVIYGKFSSDSAAATGCSSKGGYTYVTCNGTKKYVKRGTLSSRGTTKQTCQNTHFQSEATTYNYKKYSSNLYTTECYKSYTEKICKCVTTSSSTQTGYTYKNLHTAKASVKTEDGTIVSAYCISPGLAFPTSTTPYTSVVEEFDLNKCGQEGGNKYGCGIASIMLSAKEKGYDTEYATMITAFRLWAAAMGQEPDGNWSTDLITTNPIYKTTAQKANGGYKGTDDKTLNDQYVIHATGTGLTYLQHAIELYNIAKSGEFETWVPYISNGSTPIELERDGQFDFTITTNFDEEKTTEIAVISKTNGISLSISSKEKCGDYYCINVHGRISGFDIENCTASMNYELQYKDERNAMGAIGLLRPTSATNYQKFAYFDKSQIGKKVELQKTIAFSCPALYECDMPNIDYSNQTSGCHNEGTEGEIIDPTVECILNVSSLRENYDYSDIYIHDTGVKYTNDYCEVKCRETIKYEMYDSTNAVSVRFIKYTNGSHNANALLATISGDRDCVADIDYDSWKAEYETANELVRTTWNTYKYWENVHINTTPEKEEFSCNKTFGGCSSCCSYTGEPCSTNKETGKTTCTTHYYGAASYSCVYTGYKLYWREKYYSVTNSDGSTSLDISAEEDGDNGCTCSKCTGCTSCYKRDGNYNAWYGDWFRAKKAYEDAVKAREELISYIQDCNLYSSFSLRSAFGYTRSNNNSVYYEATEGYDFDPNYEYQYEDEYSNTIQIDKDTKLVSTPSAKYCVGCTETSALGGSTTEELKYWRCNGTGTGAKCTDIKVVVPKNTMALVEGIVKETYFWQSVEYSSTVPTGEIVTGEGYNSLLLSDKNIFPLEIGKLSGTYYANSVHGNVGDADRKQAVDFQEGAQGSEYIEDYECDFEVDNEITIVPDPACPTCPVVEEDDCPGCSGKYGYYYRQIDLTNMFPSGVHTGTWSTVQAQALISEIESKGETIYTTTPAYEFVITPKNIRAIKEYNREMEAYGDGYNDFNLSCDCVTGICYCNSEFLSELADGGYYSDLVSVYKKDGITYRSGN